MPAERDVMNEAERNALRDLHECQGMVYTKNYSEDENKVMGELQKLHLVELAWVITEKGKKEASHL